ncbi:MAG: hypothetical protein J3K34DRAFT_525119 [Monoraphidium minutum]|nr:MAG: hypothetical protein J3K34DRAFT_525119 [Monoraphidium minutum]
MDSAAASWARAAMRHAARDAPPPAVVVSDPLAELVVGGRSAKHVKDCVELRLSGRGIERLAGFERLTNLEVLWLNGNALPQISNLESNGRLRELYVHDNRVCTLKGSIGGLKFLTHLDLGNNALRDLPRQLARLQRLRCLRHLNLQAHTPTRAHACMRLPPRPCLGPARGPAGLGNPCCEEPGYRLRVVYQMPWLEVLDFHEVTPAERRAARERIGGEAALLTVAFGRRAPAGGSGGSGRGLQRQSVLELELAQTAAGVRDARLEARERSEREAFALNPDAAFWAPRAAPPPPPGVAAVLGAAAAARAWGAVSGAAAEGRLPAAEAASRRSRRDAGASTGADEAVAPAPESAPGRAAAAAELGVQKDSYRDELLGLKDVEERPGDMAADSNGGGGAAADGAPAMPAPAARAPPGRRRSDAIWRSGTASAAAAEARGGGGGSGGSGEDDERIVQQTTRRRVPPAAAPAPARGAAAAAPRAPLAAAGAKAPRKARSRNGTALPPPEPGMPEEDFARLYRYGVRPEDYGWRKRKPINYAARLELWEHPATKVDIYITAHKAKVIDTANGSAQTFHPLGCRADAEAFWARWAGLGK